jgi:chromosome segregation ATPase
MHSHQDFIYNPDCEQMITAILSVVIDRPHLPLPPEYNSTLLHVLESYNSLVKSLEKEKYNTEIDTLAMEQTLRDWEKDRKEFRAEIKRLEDRIAQLQGVEAMLKARENSILRKKNYETSDGAIARIRRKGKSREKSGSSHKCKLSQTSFLGYPRCANHP